MPCICQYSKPHSRQETYYKTLSKRMEDLHKVLDSSVTEEFREAAMRGVKVPVKFESGSANEQVPVKEGHFLVQTDTAMLRGEI